MVSEDTRADEAEYDIAAPGAAELFESLRAFGYDLQTALADVIDNSITAEARNIWITFTWLGRSSRITIRDDGKGMTEAELVQAMRPASRSPTEVRLEGDLGRFGLGMKTASISQCRCLTVVSRVEGGDLCARRWDLDYIAEKAMGEWRLLKGSELVSDDDKLELNSTRSGTLLCWDRLDQLIGDADPEDEAAQRIFRERIDGVRDHLAMTFHRFMKGRNAVAFHLNGRKIAPWDPFLEDEDATEFLPEEKLESDHHTVVVVKPFILPHQSKISTEVHAAAAGPKGWNAHQGFYIYRNRRLLVAGDWLGLGVRQEEHFKLARIRIDLPNTADLAWQIDVKKSQARPPAELRKDLSRIARTARGRAVRIYRQRGKVISRDLGDEKAFLWKQVVKHGKTFYKINRDHPIVRLALATSSDGPAVRALLSLVEQTVPAPLIVINNAEAPDSLGIPYSDAPRELQEAMKQMHEALIEEGYTAVEAAHRLASMEPFQHHPAEIAAFIESVAATGVRHLQERKDS